MLSANVDDWGSMCTGTPFFIEMENEGQTVVSTAYIFTSGFNVFSATAVPATKPPPPSVKIIQKE